MVTPTEARSRADSILELHEAGELDEAVAEVERLLADLDGVDLEDPVLRESLFTARFERAVLLTELGELDVAAEAYLVAARTPADLDDPDQRHEVALSLLNRGICLDAVGDHAAALEVYAELVDRFEEADDPVTADQVARARVNRAATLFALDRVEESLTAAGAARADLDPGDALTSEQHVMAARLEAAALRQLGRDAHALDVLEALVEVSRADPATRCQLAAAVEEQADLLVDSGEVTAAIELLDRTIGDAEGDMDPEVQAAVAELSGLRVRLGAH